MLLHNIDVDDKLANGTIGTIVYMHMNRSAPLDGTLYIKFDQPDAGNKRKNSKLEVSKLRDCVPIKAKTMRFTLGINANRTATFHRKQYPGILSFGNTIHKSQGNQYQYVEADFDRTSRGKNPAPVFPGQTYTAMSRATEPDGLKLTNFTHDLIKVNKNALKEQEWLRTDKLFKCQHIIHQLEGFKAAMVNIRSWNAYLKHFISDPYLLSKCCFCVFTETNTSNIQDSITNYNSQWEEVHMSIGHGLALCYN